MISRAGSHCPHRTARLHWRWFTAARGFAAALAALIGVAGSGPLEARSLQAPASRIVIDLPDGFAVAQRFTGFQHPSGASVVILEVPPAAYDQMKPAMSGDLLATKGIVDVAPLALDRAGDYVALTGRQGTPQGWFAKIMLLIRGEEATALITANVPEAAFASGELDREAMIAAIASAAFAAERKPDAPLPYRLADTGSLRPAGTIAGAGLVYTPDGRLPTTKLTRTRKSFLVVHSLGSRQRAVVIDIGVYGRRLINGLTGLADVTVDSETQVTVAGFKGVIHTGQATSRTTGDAVVIYHMTLIDPAGGYYRLFGEAPADDGDAALREFDRIARSFELTGR